ncbi:MAG: restriction endonuclease [Opitutaceae bacterium]
MRLVNGRVERISAKSVVPPAAPAPKADVPSTPPPVESPEISKDPGAPFAEVWLTRFEDATRDAARRNSVILALFTSSDASPASRQFQKEIVLHPEFVNAFRAHYVLLQVDFPVRAELSPALRAQNEALRERYAVNALPALLILSAAGDKLATVEISDSVPGHAFRARLIAAVAAAYELPTPIAPEPAPPPPPTPRPAAASMPVAPAQVTSGLTTARWLIASALAVGTLLAGIMLFALWLFLRKVNKPVALTRPTSMASRISQAASGLPTYAEIRTWSKEMMGHVIIRLAETEGYVAEEQPAGSDKDLVLKRPGNPAPAIIVCHVTGNAGVIPTRRIREMVGMLAADDVSEGWFVSPTGFSMDACAYAEQNNIRLIDASVLLDRLSDLPSFALPKVLSTVR